MLIYTVKLQNFLQTSLEDSKGGLFFSFHLLKIIIHIFSSLYTTDLKK